MQEKNNGQDGNVPLGYLEATDPDDDPIEYDLMDDADNRFDIRRSNGMVVYVGPGENYEAGPPYYELMGVARDPAGLKATVPVMVMVMPENRRPSAVDDAAETPEDTPVLIDVLANDSDPDGDRMQILTVTEPSHGTATVVAGEVRYVPTADYHGPDAFSYTAGDGGGLTARATVAVTVLPENRRPSAVDDAAETPEDTPVLIDVLANDSDPDGDRMQILTVTEPSHGTATVVAGEVRYVPVRDYHGPDAFSYTVSDGGGLTAKATVAVTVLPVNEAPAPVGIIPEQAVEEGEGPLTLDLSSYFTDVDGDVLTFTAVSSDPSAATVTVTGSTLTLTPVVTGVAMVTVTATDPGGLTAVHVFGVAVGDRLVREVLTDTLAALGRGYLSSVRQTVGRRLETDDRTADRMTLAGQSWAPGALDRLGAFSLPQAHAWRVRAATLSQSDAASSLAGTTADPYQQHLGPGGSFGDVGGRDQMLQGTDMALSFGGVGQTEPDAAGGGRRWTVWGQGDLQTFRGTPAAAQQYDGDLRTGYLGFDAELNRQWLLGVAVARSAGEGGWRTGTAAGQMTTSLTTVYPYLRWRGGDTAVWAVLGAGRGTATLVRTVNGRQDSSPLSLGLGLIEARRRIATLGRGLEIGLRGEASWAQLATGAGDTTIDALQAGVRRLRGGVELTRQLAGPGGSNWTPFGALSTRHDGGAGQTGVGLEVAGGVRVRGGRVKLEAQARRLVLHSATGYTDQGVSVAASVGAGHQEPGLSLSVRPTWGTPGAGAQTLWQEQIRTYMQGADYGGAGVDARVGYGLRLRGGGLLTPFGGYGQQAGSGRRLQFGTRVGTLGRVLGAAESPLELELSGERYARPGLTADHRFSMLGVVTFGARSPEKWELMNPETGTGAVLEEAGAIPFESATAMAVDYTRDARLAPATVPTTSTNEVAAAPAFTVNEPVVDSSGTDEIIPTRVDLEPIESIAALPVAVRSQPPPAIERVAATAYDAESNLPPAFTAGTYEFELLESPGRSGSAVPLGTVAARDPDSDPVIYSLTAGDWTRFRVEPASGAIAYVGPAGDREAPRRYELTVTARDTDRLTAAATVVVTVVSIDKPPFAVDDAVEVFANQPLVIDVLANDRGMDGDRLQVVAVAAPAHGIATVANGGVRYVPASGYHGPDTFSYTVAGRTGLARRATVALTVTPADGAVIARGDVAEGSEQIPVTETVKDAPVATPFENVPAGVQTAQVPAEVTREVSEASPEQSRSKTGKRRPASLRHLRLHHRH